MTGGAVTAYSTFDEIGVRYALLLITPYFITPTSVSVIRVGHRAATMLPIYDELHCTPPILSVDGLSIGVAGERAFFEFGDRAAHGMALLSRQRFSRRGPGCTTQGA